MTARLLALFVSAILGWSGLSLPPQLRGQEAARGSSRRPERIISIIPAVTEMLFAIGAGPQVVGVGSFDRHPPEVEHLPRVGALLDPDTERMLALRPDLVIVYASQTDLIAQLRRAGIPLYIYAHAGLADVTATIRQLGSRTGHAQDAERVAAGIEERLRAIEARIANRPRPRTLLVFGRESMALRTIYASGGVGFLHDMLEVAGGSNILADIKQQSVQATTELILTRRPDVIVELRISDKDPASLARERTVWNALSSVPAVKAGRVYVLPGERIGVPGPGVAESAEQIARVLHPEVVASMRKPLRCEVRGRSCKVRVQGATYHA